MVNHEDREVEFNGRMVMVKRGERLTSIEKLAARWGWNRKRVMRFLGLLEEAEMVTTKRTPNGTTIKVRKFNTYQGKTDDAGTTNGTTKGTTHGTGVGTQTRMNKNDKEDIRTRARAKDHDPMNPAPKFNNSPQREYDMQELEKMLLRTN